MRRPGEERPAGRPRGPAWRPHRRGEQGIIIMIIIILIMIILMIIIVIVIIIIILMIMTMTTLMIILPGEQNPGAPPEDVGSQSRSERAEG